MSVVEWVRELGGVTTRRTLVRLASRAELERALATGDLVRCGRSRVALPQVDEAVRLAAAAGGVLSHESAALHHGWAVVRVPDRPHVTVPRWRVVDPRLATRLHVHYANLTRNQIDGPATSKEETLATCLRRCPFGAALAVADSALRAGFGPEALRRIAEDARGPGSPQMRRVAHEASPRAANPFESALRAIGLDIPGLALVPQVVIEEGGVRVRPDLVDETLRMVAEADSFEWHGGRRALARDARRYNFLVVRGWMVLRFSWEDVLLDPEHVRDVLMAAVALAQMRKQVRPRRRSVA